MCKQDPCPRLLRLHADLEQVAPAFGCEAKSPGTPLVAIELDACLASDTSAVSSDETACTTTIFFARVPPMVPYDDLHALFSRFGTVQHLNLFRRWATAKTSKGCGTVQYSKAEEASAAMLALHGVHTFADYPGSEAGPMVVEWMDASRLTAPPAVATAPKAVKAPPKTSAKPQQKPRLKGANSSSSSNSMAGWQYVQQLTAIAQQSRAASAAAAAATGCGFLQQGGLGGAYPALEALDVSGLLPHLVSDSNSVGLGEPVSWGTVIPVHLLPMGTTAQMSSTVGSANMPSWSPLMPSAAAAAAAAPASALSAMSLSPMLQPSVPGSDTTASTPGHMLSPGSSSTGCGVDLMAPDAPGALPGPAFRPWFSGVLPTQTDTSNLSLAAGSSFAPASGSFIAAAAAEQRSAEQQQLQQSNGPLFVLEDMWGPQSCDGLASAASNTASRHQLSGGYGLFESRLLLGQLNEAASASAAAAASVGANTGSASAAAGHAGNQQHCISQADACEFLSGGMSGFLTGEGSLSGFLSENGLAAVPTRDAAAGTTSEGYLPMPSNAGNIGSSSTQPQRLQESDTVQAELHASTAGESLGQLIVNMPHIAKITGAKIQMTVGPVNTQFKLQGSAAEVEAARNLMQLLSPTHTAVV